MTDIDEVSLNVVKAIDEIDINGLPGGRTQARAQAQILIRNAIEEQLNEQAARTARIVGVVNASGLVRYCYECGTIGEIDREKHINCCPDGNRAQYVRREVAEQAREGFLSSIRPPVPVDVAQVATDVLEAVAEAAKESGPLSEADIREAIPAMVAMLAMANLDEPEDPEV